MNRLKTVVSFSFLLFLAACGGGGGSSTSTTSTTTTSLTVASLTGTWYGSQEDQNLVMHSMSVTVNSSGIISQISVDGVSTGQYSTSAIVQNAANKNLFSATLNDGTIVGFFADNTASHVAYLDQNTNVGALQKGATSLPTFAGTDVVGAWTGYSVTLDSLMNLVSKFSSNATVTGTTFTGTDTAAGAFSGSFTTWNSVYGRYRGTFTQSTVSGIVRTFLSADKTFAMSYSCPNGVTGFVSVCTFSAWSK